MDHLLFSRTLEPRKDAIVDHKQYAHLVNARASFDQDVPSCIFLCVVLSTAARYPLVQSRGCLLRHGVHLPTGFAADGASGGCHLR